MIKGFKKYLLLITLFFTIGSLKAEEKKTPDFAPINTAVPMLTIAPDARGGGMGDNGASTTPDVSSQYWNPAKYAFHYSKSGVALSYTPWLTKLVNDVALANLSGFYKIGENDNQAIGASLRYFSLGDIPLNTIENPDPSRYINPYDLAIDFSYSRKLSESYSMAVALRYIRSDMSDSEGDMNPGNSYAADIAGYMEKYVVLGASESLWSLGFNISNIGTKMTFDDGIKNYFIPTTMRIGTGLLYPLDDYNRISFHLDLSKYLVPSVPAKTGDAKLDEEKMTEYNNMPFMTGIFKSLNDAPGGFGEEMKEVMISFGSEYSYNDQFFLRGGYYYENPQKGNRQYFSAGAGFKMSVFQLDAAYLISTVPNNPLDQTLRFSLSFDMDGVKNLFK